MPNDVNLKKEDPENEEPNKNNGNEKPIENNENEEDNENKKYDINNKEILNREIIEKHLKIVKDIVGKVADDVGTTVDDVVLNAKSFGKDVDSKIKEYKSTINVDLLDSGDYFYLKADLPGIDKESVNVEVNDKDLIISAVFTGFSNDLNNEEQKFLIQSRNFGLVKKIITLPTKVKSDEIKAELNDGVLSLTLPKTETTKIDVNFN
jgi:HSP20 family protein